MRVAKGKGLWDRNGWKRAGKREGKREFEGHYRYFSARREKREGGPGEVGGIMSKG